MQRAEVYGAVKGDLSEIMKTINSAQHLIFLFDSLTTEQRVTVCRTIYKKIPELINCPMDFSSFIECVYENHRDKFYQDVLDVLPRIIKYGRDLLSVVNHLSPEQALFVCKVLLSRTDEEEQNDPFLYSHIEKKLSDVYQKLGDKLPCFIENGEDFRLALARFDSKVKKVFIKHLIDMIKSDEFGIIARYIEVGYFFSQSSRVEIDSLEDEGRGNSLKKFFDIMSLKPQGCL